MSQVVLMYVVGALLVVITVFLSYQIAKKTDIKGLFKTGFSHFNEKYKKRKLLGLVQKYTRAVSIKMSIIDKLQFKYVDRLNLRSKVPGILAGFINIYAVFVINIIIFVASFPVIYRTVMSIPSAVILSVMLAILPYFILDFIVRSNSEKVRRKMADFIAVLNRWIDVKEDIFYAFKKTVSFDIKNGDKIGVSVVAEPLRTYIWDMLIQVEMGVEPFEALDNMDRKVDNLQFSDFILNVKQIIKSRGNIKVLLSNMEDQYYKLEEEYNRRKISTLKDRALIFLSIIMTSGVAYYLLRYNPEVNTFYTNTTIGQILLGVFSLMFLIGLIITLSISTYKY